MSTTAQIDENRNIDQAPKNPQAKTNAINPDAINRAKAAIATALAPLTALQPAPPVQPTPIDKATETQKRTPSLPPPIPAEARRKTTSEPNAKPQTDTEPQRPAAKTPSIPPPAPTESLASQLESNQKKLANFEAEIKELAKVQVAIEQNLNNSKIPISEPGEILVNLGNAGIEVKSLNELEAKKSSLAEKLLEESKKLLAAGVDPMGSNTWKSLNAQRNVIQTALSDSNKTGRDIVEMLLAHNWNIKRGNKIREEVRQLKTDIERQERALPLRNLNEALATVEKRCAAFINGKNYSHEAVKSLEDFKGLVLEALENKVRPHVDNAIYFQQLSKIEQLFDDALVQKEKTGLAQTTTTVPEAKATPTEKTDPEKELKKSYLKTLKDLAPKTEAFIKDFGEETILEGDINGFLNTETARILKENNLEGTEYAKNILEQTRRDIANHNEKVLKRSQPSSSVNNSEAEPVVAPSQAQTTAAAPVEPDPSLAEDAKETDTNETIKNIVESLKQPLAELLAKFPNQNIYQNEVSNFLQKEVLPRIDQAGLKDTAARFEIPKRIYDEIDNHNLNATKVYAKAFKELAPKTEAFIKDFGEETILEGDINGFLNTETARILKENKLEGTEYGKNILENTRRDIANHNEKVLKRSQPSSSVNNSEAEPVVAPSQAQTTAAAPVEPDPSLAEDGSETATAEAANQYLAAQHPEIDTTARTEILTAAEPQLSEIKTNRSRLTQAWAKAKTGLEKAAAKVSNKVKDVVAKKPKTSVSDQVNKIGAYLEQQKQEAANSNELLLEVGIMAKVSYELTQIKGLSPEQRTQLENVARLNIKQFNKSIERKRKQSQAAAIAPSNQAPQIISTGRNINPDSVLTGQQKNRNEAATNPPITQPSEAQNQTQQRIMEMLSNTAKANPDEAFAIAADSLQKLAANTDTPVSRNVRSIGQEIDSLIALAESNGDTISADTGDRITAKINSELKVLAPELAQTLIKKFLQRVQAHNEILKNEIATEMENDTKETEAAADIAVENIPLPQVKLQAVENNVPSPINESSGKNLDIIEGDAIKILLENKENGVNALKELITLYRNHGEMVIANQLNNIFLNMVEHMTETDIGFSIDQAIRINDSVMDIPGLNLEMKKRLGKTVSQTIQKYNDKSTGRFSEAA